MEVRVKWVKCLKIKRRRVGVQLVRFGGRLCVCRNHLCSTVLPAPFGAPTGGEEHYADLYYEDAVNPLNIVVYLPRAIWKAGYKYTYALNFTPTEIIVDPTVSAWDGTPVDVIL